MAASIYMTFCVYGFGDESAAVPFPSYHRGNFAGAVRIDGEIVSGQSQVKNPMHSSMIESFLQFEHLFMAKQFAKSEISQVLAKKLSINNFHRWPSVTDNQHDNYGLFARAGNAVYQSPTFVDGVRKPTGYISRPGKILVLEDGVHNSLRHDYNDDEAN